LVGGSNPSECAIQIPYRFQKLAKYTIAHFRTYFSLSVLAVLITHMIIYLYRWKLKTGKEEQFKKAWSYVTDQLREKSGSLGSRLHLGDDGIWYGYAQWPSAEQRTKNRLTHPEMVEARQLMNDATLEELPDVILDPVSDFLVLPRAFI
jgi:hypothetical protein